MKRLYLAIILFSLVIFTCFIETAYINYTFNDTKNTVSDFKEKCQNGVNVHDYEIDKLNEDWNKKSIYLAIFINREQLSNVSDKISLLKTAYNIDKTEFLLLTEEITSSLEEIQKIENINSFGLL